MAKQHVSFNLNGKHVDALVEPRELLVHTIRETLSLTGTHIGCESSHCGACTVDLDGKSVKSCTVLAVQADGATITTVEGLADSGRGQALREELHQLWKVERPQVTAAVHERLQGGAAANYAVRHHGRPRAGPGH